MATYTNYIRSWPSLNAYKTFLPQNHRQAYEKLREAQGLLDLAAKNTALQAYLKSNAAQLKGYQNVKAFYTAALPVYRQRCASLKLPLTPTVSTALVMPSLSVTASVQPQKSIAIPKVSITSPIQVQSLSDIQTGQSNVPSKWPTYFKYGMFGVLGVGVLFGIYTVSKGGTEPEMAMA